MKTEKISPSSLISARQKFQNSSSAGIQLLALNEKLDFFLNIFIGQEPFRG